MRLKGNMITMMLLIVLAVSLGFYGCDLTMGRAGEGTLTLTFGSAGRSIEWTPALDMEIATYTVSGTGPGDGDSFLEEGFTGSTFTKSGLTVGDWDIVVDGYNADGIQVGSAAVDVTIRKSQQTSEIATLRPLGGTGSLNLTVSWTDSESKLADPSVSAVILDESDSLIERISTPDGLTLGGDGLSATGTIESLAVGWYEVTLSLSEKIPDGDSEVVWQGVFVLRIVNGQTTSGTVVIPENLISFGTGSVSITLEEDMDDPLAVAFTGPPEDETVMYGNSVTFTSSGTYSDSAGFRWYVDGVRQTGETGLSFSYTFDEVGTYIVSLLVLDGGVLGGYSKTVEVDPYEVGDLGPSGGYVFYDDLLGYDMDGSGTIEGDEKDFLDGVNNGVLSGVRYLEAAPYGWYDGGDDPANYFGVYRSEGTYEVVGTGTAIGTGKVNTTDLVTAMGDASYFDAGDDMIEDYAARLCYIHVAGGFSDWFLPSKDELYLVYTNLKVQGLGGFSGGYYWSSSETSVNSVWDQTFSNGGQLSSSRYFMDRIRPVRCF